MLLEVFFYFMKIPKELRALNPINICVLHTINHSESRFRAICQKNLGQNIQNRIYGIMLYAKMIKRD